MSSYRILKGLGLAIALGLASAPPVAAQELPPVATQQLYGAIAFSPRTGEYGWSRNNASRAEAEEIAQSNCLKRASDCQLATWFRDACGALAVGRAGWGAHWGNNREQAEAAAIDACRQHTRNCKVVQWQCTPGR